MKFLICCLILLLSASVSRSFAASPFDGNWKQAASIGAGRECDTVKTRSCGWSGVARENEVQFHGSKFTRKVTGFSDLKKSAPQWTKKVVGKFAFTQASAPDVSQVDIRFRSVYLVALTSKRATLWNRIAFCGREDWKARLEQNVTGLVCDPLPMRVPGSTYYTSALLQDSNLYFAGDSDEKDGSSPAARPTEPDMTNAWIKK